jgi:MarR family transcriptional regulator, organic hydroperoxide resistance regulator
MDRRPQRIECESRSEMTRRDTRDIECGAKCYSRTIVPMPHRPGFELPMARSTPRNADPTALPETNPISDSFRIAEYPFYRIARVAGLYTECLDRELKPRGMDQARWRILMILREHNPAAMGLIAELAVMKLPTLFKVVRRMANEGLVRHGPRLSDQRVTEVSITPRGRRALVIIRAAAAQVYSRVTSSLTAKEIAALNALLGRVEVNLLDIGGRKIRSDVVAA